MIYIYNVDVVGEGLVARRRGMATLVDHMVPPFKPGGLTQELAKLSELMNDTERNDSKNPELAARYARQVRERRPSSSASPRTSASRTRRTGTTTTCTRSRTICSS